MVEDFFELVGKKSGPTSIILAGIHGDEKCGVEAIQKILPNIEIERGKVLFGYGNPRAIEANKRYIEVNLNRMFKDDQEISDKEKNSYEYHRAQLIKKYLNQSDALLDIHASFTVKSKPFLICEENAKNIVEYLPVDLVVSGFDEVEPGGTDYYMNSMNKIGICIECGYLGDPESSLIAEQSIYAFLAARLHITSSIAHQEQSYIHVNDLYITKTDNFVLQKSFHDFEEISKGQIIGVDGKLQVRAQKDGVILFARNRKQVGEEAFLLGENKNSLA